MVRHKIIIEGGRRIRPNPGNIDLYRTKFCDTWPNGRPFKHGALEIYFVFRPSSRISAEADVEALMEDQGWERGVDYHIPAWNYSTPKQESFWSDKLTITFNDDETFVMAKLSWGLGQDEDALSE